MCGISGIYSGFKKIADRDIDDVKTMNTIQFHRGPDAEGLFFDDGCVLGHRRLAIIDLSSQGEQPFSSVDGRYKMTYNGEIFNYKELREELITIGYQFRTTNDVEVLLTAYIHYKEACLNKLNGMFAFAIYDATEKSLFIARDRFGIKPLYYTLFDEKFYFASEIKALKAIKGISKSIDEHTLFNYLCFNRTDIFDETFNNDIKRLPKGHYATVDVNGIAIKQWWNAEWFIQKRCEDSYENILKTTEDLLVSSIELRLRSDVPLGSCLSGGLDSSIITGILYEKLKIPNGYKTFTASFPGYAIDETNYVDLLNKKYPFQNFRTFPNGKDAFNNIFEFIKVNDEPTTSPSFYSQYEVMRLAKHHGVTVLLDGQGGDESFAGYQYFHGFHFSSLYKKGNYGKLFTELYSAYVRKQEKEAFQTFIFQIVPDYVGKYLLLKTLPNINKNFFYDHVDQSVIFNDFFRADSLNKSLVKHFQYKLEHLLRTEDRNSMAFQIEARVPYLDYRLVEYLLGVDEHLKIKKGENKILQKQALGKYTIPEILNRLDKIGFGTPADTWMRSPEWEKITTTNYKKACDYFPHTFNSNSELKYNLFDRWKINQLVIWYENFN